MNYRSLRHAQQGVLRLAAALPRPVDLVVGVPRSGLLFGNLLSLYLNCPLTDPDGFLSGHVHRSGLRGRRAMGKDTFKERTVVVFDDSVCSGRQLHEVKALCAPRSAECSLIYVCLYVTPEARNLVDYYDEVVAWPRVFEWNILHHEILQRSCLDLDGVLCVDPRDEENDDSTCYLHFLENARELVVPTVPVGWVVTCRLEKYRQHTEAWLKTHGVVYGALIMWDLPSAEARRRTNAHGIFKGHIYRSLDARLFVESNAHQARQIADISGKPVLCPWTGDMVLPQHRIKPLHSVARSASQRVGRWLRRSGVGRLASKARWLFYEQ